MSTSCQHPPLYSGMKSNCLSCHTPLEYSPSRKLKYCNNTCQHDYQRENVVIPRIIRGECHERKILKKYLIEWRGHACEKCNGTKWNNQSMPLELDHEDGDASNDLPDNLRLLCPNCHALTPTAKGKNRGNGRKARGVPVR